MRVGRQGHATPWRPPLTSPAACVRVRDSVANSLRSSLLLKSARLMRQRTPPSGLRALLAEDTGFEPVRGCPLHAFQACALGHYANPPLSRVPGQTACFGRRCVQHTGHGMRKSHRVECALAPHVAASCLTPQGRKAARVRGPYRVRGGSFHVRTRSAPTRQPGPIE